MAVTVLFLGPLADSEGAAEREFAGPLDWDGLLACVTPETVKQLNGPRIRVACNGVVLAGKALLQAKDGDEIALLPPVSGG